MPFTFAHPAIVLPLVKRHDYLSASGLVVGSIAPDFEAFIRFGEYKVHSHTWDGVIWMDIPMAYALLYGYQIIVRKPLIAHLPSGLQKRLNVNTGEAWHQYHMAHFQEVLLSIILGILSHMVWDAFTHLNIFFPDAITSDVMIGEHRLYIILQYLCSAVGQAFVFYYLYKLPTDKPIIMKEGKFSFWLYWMLTSVLFFTCVITYVWGDPGWLDKIYLINLAISAMLYALLIVSYVDRFILNYTAYKAKVY